MCGISGFFNIFDSGAQQLLRQLNDAQVHRGPDDGDLWLSPPHGTGLAHRRLSIVDLSPLGRQPMSSESGRYVIVYNGEVYNFRELRDDLAGRGHRFRGGSDTEVMLAGFEEWGVAPTVERLNGMFAAAVYDHKEAKLHLFRDRLGVKPLYYQWHRGGFYFSSELSKPFARIASRSVDRDALALYFRHYYIPAPKTIFQGIYKLQPGVIATLTTKSAQAGRFETVAAYWSTQDRINARLANLYREMTMEQALDLLDSALNRSISQRMIADVPLGAFLSGGIDSSLITAYMQKLSPVPVKTFTIGFSEERFNEAESARKIAAHLGTEHTEFCVTDQDARDVIPKLSRMYGEPFADSSQIPTYLVSKLTREKVTVALSGDGGDELFAGYRLYERPSKINCFKAVIPPSIALYLAKGLAIPSFRRGIGRVFSSDRNRQLIKALRLCAGDREMDVPSSLDDHIMAPEMLVIGASSEGSIQPLRRCLGNYTEQLMCDNLMVYLPDDIFVKVDRASMANSLEVRAPFADDWELFDAAWKIPFNLKFQRGEGKIVLKHLLARHLPRELFYRPKQGFAIPLRSWLHGPLREWVGDLLETDRICKDGNLDHMTVAGIKAKSINSDAFAAVLWAICMFQSWLDEFHG